jgi:phage repressor protein C with HTH and peptisase S24 domain
MLDKPDYGIRLEHEFERLGGVANVADRVGVARNTLYNWAQKGNVPLNKLLELGRIGLNVAYVVDDAQNVEHVAAECEREAKFPSAGIFDADADEFAYIPLYPVEASAGPGALVEDGPPVCRLAFRRDWLSSEGLHARTLAALTARGDSMIPTISPGALLLIDTARAFPHREGVYVLQANGELRVKRISPRADGALLLSSDNPLYAPESVPPDLAKTLNVVGLVVLVSQRID